MPSSNSRMAVAVAGATTAPTVDAAERLLPWLALWWTAGKTEIHAGTADG